MAEKRKPASAAKNTRSAKAKKPASGVSGKVGTAKRKKTAAGTSVKSAATLVSDELACEMMERLCKLYPDADCELTYKSKFQLLTSVIMSAQTTDAQVNKVTPELFRRFPDAQALSKADPEQVRQIIKPTGYYNAKAESIQKCARALVERFGGEVPDNLEALITLPGVGRKTANVVLGVIYGQPAWTVDTHVQRLSAKMGFTVQTDPYKIELDLQKRFPGKDWSKYSITIIWHGRRLCYARNPNCASCPLQDICPSSLV